MASSTNMKSDCPICGILFQNRGDLADHVKSYQVKINAILVRMQIVSQQEPPVEIASLVRLLQQLVLHRSIPSESSIAEESVHFAPDPTFGSHTAVPSVLTNCNEEQQQSLKCPHEVCHGVSQSFSRNQDLERHYALHVELQQNCTICNTPFSLAKDCWQHNCASTNKFQQRRIKKQRKDVRQDVRKAISLKRGTNESEQNSNRLGERNSDKSLPNALTNSPPRRPTAEDNDRLGRTSSAAILQDSHGLIWSAPVCSSQTTIQGNNGLVYDEPLAAIYTSMNTAGHQTAFAQHPFNAGVYSQFKLPDQSRSSGQDGLASATMLDQIRSDTNY